MAESFLPRTTVSEVALRHGLNRGLLWHWRREVREHASSEQPPFVPIRIAEEAAVLTKAAVSGQQERSVSPGAGRSGEGLPSPLDGSIDIEIGDARVRISGSVDAAALRQVLCISNAGRDPRSAGAAGLRILVTARPIDLRKGVDSLCTLLKQCLSFGASLKAEHDTSTSRAGACCRAGPKTRRPPRTPMAAKAGTAAGTGMFRDAFDAPMLDAG